MKKNKSGISILFEEMVKRGLISSGSLWIERAAAQKNTSLPVSIACSRLITYDRIDRKIIALKSCN